MKTGVILPRNSATFRRVMRDQAGKPLRTLVFEPGQVAELEDDELQAVRHDIGPLLKIAAQVEGKSAPKADHAATDAFVTMVQEADAKEKAERLKAKAERAKPKAK
jgi:hypothetical protein